MTSPTAKPAAPSLRALDSGPTPVLELELLASLEQRLQALERTASSPTAMAHLLMNLEAGMMQRIQMMSDTMTIMFGRIAEMLREVAESDPADETANLLEMVTKLSEKPAMPPVERPAPKGRRKR